MNWNTTSARKSLVLACACLFSVGLLTAGAAPAEWPTAKAIRVVVPFVPAGLVDIIGRILADHLRQELNQAIVLENRPGAAGVIGSTQVMRAEPDGYTLVLGGLAPQVIAPLAAETPPYDAIRDFTNIAYLGGPPVLVVVSAKSDFHSLDDLVKAAKADKLAGYATSGFGTSGHIIMEMIWKTYGVHVPPVHYNGPALNDIIGGRIPVGIVSFGAVLGQIQGGLVRGVAISTPTRNSSVPDVPTFKELGMDMVATSWVSVSAPKALPESITAKLNAVTNKVTMLPEVKARLYQDGVEPIAMSPAELSDFYKAEIARWTPITRDAIKTVR